MKNNMYFEDLDASIVKLNALLADGDIKKIDTAKADAYAKLGTLNSELVTEAYMKFAADIDPMLAAITQCYIRQYTIKEEREKETKRVNMYSIDNKKTIVIDLSAFEKWHIQQLSAPLSLNGQWIYWVESFTYRLNARAIERVEGDIDSFKRTSIVSAAALTEDILPNPTSKTQIKKALQKIVDAIIFEAIDDGEENKYCVLSKDVNFLLDVMTKKGKKTSIVCARTTTMTALITEIIHRIVNNGEYTAEYATQKPKS